MTTTQRVSSEPGDPVVAEPPPAVPPARGPLARLRGGELGALPVVVGLVVTWLVFQLLNDRFLTPQNLSNMVVQVAAIGLMAVGVTLVLLLGEIDLSIGSVSGLAAATLAVLATRHGLPEALAIGIVVLVGIAVGTVQGAIRTKIGVPSFVVTLAGLIGWQGLHLYLLGPQGAINIDDSGVIAAIANTYLVPASGWAIAVLALAGYVAAVLVDTRRRAAAGLPARPMWQRGLRVAALAIGLAVAVSVLNQWRGVPLALLVLVGFAVAFDLVLRRTRFGRGVLAVGGNAEAARRAGIRVDRIRIIVFAIGSGMAAIGGIMAVSRLFSATQSTGANNELLFAIAAAVIGGTSLFGGRGSTYGALLGVLVIGSITNGMDLLQLDSSVRFMITAAVLLIAVVIDSLSRRGRRSTGRE